MYKLPQSKFISHGLKSGRHRGKLSIVNRKRGLLVSILLSSLGVPISGQLEIGDVPPCGIISLEPTNDWSKGPVLNRNRYQYDFTLQIYNGEESGSTRCLEQIVYGVYWIVPARMANSHPHSFWHVADTHSIIKETDEHGILTMGGNFPSGLFQVHEYLQTRPRIDLRARVDVREFDRRSGQYRYFPVYEWSNGRHIDLRHSSAILTWWWTAQYYNNEAVKDRLQFLMEGGNRTFGYNEREDRVIYTPVPAWSDIDMPAPECDVIGDVYDSCTARNQIISYTHTDGLIKSYSLEVTKSHDDDDVSVELSRRTYSDEDAAIQSYGNKTVLSDNISCDATRILLTDDADRHVHLAPYGLKMACIWVEDNVSRDATNTTLSLW